MFMVNFSDESGIRKRALQRSLCLRHARVCFTCINWRLSLTFTRVDSTISVHIYGEFLMSITKEFLANSMHSRVKLLPI